MAGGGPGSLGAGSGSFVIGSSGNSLNTNVLVYHGATDAPTVDIVAGPTTLVNDISYAAFNASYLQLPTADYTIAVTDASGTNTVATYSAPLATLNLQGNSLVALASGFLNPANNSNGANFGIWVALPAGGDLIPLPVVTSIESKKLSNTLSIYPNPASDKLIIVNPSYITENTVATIYNHIGEIVLNQQLSANQTGLTTIEIENFSNGFYTIEIVNNQTRLMSKFSVTK